MYNIIADELINIQANVLAGKSKEEMTKLIERKLEVYAYADFAIEFDDYIKGLKSTDLRHIKFGNYDNEAHRRLQRHKYFYKYIDAHSKIAQAKTKKEDDLDDHEKKRQLLIDIINKQLKETGIDQPKMEKTL